MNEQQVLILDTARAWLDEYAPVTALRRVRDEEMLFGRDQTIVRLAYEQGWSGVIVPEAAGGAELGYVSAFLIAEQMGRNLSPIPYSGSALGAVAALRFKADSPACNELLAAIAQGSKTAALAIDEGPHHEPALTESSAVRSATGYVLTGQKVSVHDGMTADVFMVLARISEPRQKGEDELRLLVVPAGAAGVTRRERKLMDYRGYGDVTFDGVEVPADALIDDRAAVEAVLNVMYVATASELYGLSERSFEMTIDYLKTRVQFDQVIGSFQALQHRAAELYTQLQLARCTVRAAAAALEQKKDHVSRSASLSKAMCSDVANHATRELIQLHGGIAMTDEFDAGFYIKRSRVLETAFGSAGWHKERYASICSI